MNSTSYSCATFCADVTPSIGSPLCCNLIPSAVEIGDRLEARGFILTGGKRPVVFVSLDWCGLRNSAHDLWRESIARAADTDADYVFLTCVHQHDASLVDPEASQILRVAGLPNLIYDEDSLANALQATTTAIRESLDKTIPVDGFGVGGARVFGVASNRRILGNDGKVALVRYSRCVSPEAQQAPEGLIDSEISSLVFFSGEKPVVALSTYACHPMSKYGKGIISADFVGRARSWLQDDDPTCFQIYANGCAGNITAGKYNVWEEKSTERLARRLYSAWRQSTLSAQREPLSEPTVKHYPLDIPFAPPLGWSEKDLHAALQDTSPSAIKRRITAAITLSYQEYVARAKTIDLPVLEIGSARLLLLPGEPFIEYQLFAKSLGSAGRTLVVGYANCGPGYLPLHGSYEEGGYEPTMACGSRSAEKPLRDAIRKAIN